MSNKIILLLLYHLTSFALPREFLDEAGTSEKRVCLFHHPEHILEIQQLYGNLPTLQANPKINVFDPMFSPDSKESLFFCAEAEGIILNATLKDAFIPRYLVASGIRDCVCLFGNANDASSHLFFHFFREEFKKGPNAPYCLFDKSLEMINEIFPKESTLYLVSAYYTPIFETVFFSLKDKGYTIKEAFVPEATLREGLVKDPVYRYRALIQDFSYLNIPCLSFYPITFLQPLYQNLFCDAKSVKLTPYYPISLYLQRFSYKNYFYKPTAEECAMPFEYMEVSLDKHASIHYDQNKKEAHAQELKIVFDIEKNQIGIGHQAITDF